MDATSLLGKKLSNWEQKWSLSWLFQRMEYIRWLRLPEAAGITKHNFDFGLCEIAHLLGYFLNGGKVWLSLSLPPLNLTVLSFPYCQHGCLVFNSHALRLGV
ncbi:MAG TPA: hypothetical protein VL380_07905 [Nitrosospira sp.]|nr:hypothetical protein [Nitrosospira sp.]